jgi:hypothetical protein
MFPRLHLTLAALGILSLLAFNGCGDDNEDKTPTSPGGGGSTSFFGTYVNGSESGMMTITVNTTSLAGALQANATRTASVTASGTITPDGYASFPLTGTYDAATDSLYLSDGVYFFGGKYGTIGSVTGIAGRYIGGHGYGQFGCVQGTSSSIQIYCGTYQNADVSDTGNWNLVVSGISIVGVSFQTGDDQGIPFQGIIAGTGTTRSITVGHDDGSGNTLSATGSLNTTTHVMSGVWHTYASSSPVDNGTWTADLCTTSTP